MIPMSLQAMHIKYLTDVDRICMDSAMHSHLTIFERGGNVIVGLLYYTKIM